MTEEGEGRGEKKASKRANSDPLERRFTVKGFTNRRQVFATSADRKLSRLLPPLFVQHPSSARPLARSLGPPPSHPGAPSIAKRREPLLLHAHRSPLPYR